MQFAERENQKDDASLLIGSEALAMLADAETNKVRQERVKEFFCSVRKYFVAICAYLTKKLPLQEPLLRYVQIIDPAKQLEAEPSSLIYVLDRFPALVPADSSRDVVLEEFARYQLADIEPFRWKEGKRDKGGKKKPERVDKVWAQIADQVSVPALGRVVTGLMTIPHSSAACERFFFSAVRKNSTEQKASLSNDVLEAVLVIKSRPSDLVNLVDNYSKEQLRQIKGAYYHSLKKY